MEDISANLDKSQFGNRIGTDTEHLLVKLLDEHKNKSAVIVTIIDWASAFDRQDTTLAIKKFLQFLVQNNDNADCLE